MYFVYLLLCQDGSLYTGYSVNVAQRFQLHQMGKGAKYTRSHYPLKVVFTQSFETKSAALQREHEIKRWTHQQKIDNLALQL